MFAIIREQIVPSPFGYMRLTHSARPMLALLMRDIHPSTRTKFSFAADVFAFERRIVQHTAVAQRHPTMHHKSFPPRHDIAGTRSAAHIDPLLATGLARFIPNAFLNG
jgi:hypothetical protein